MFGEKILDVDRKAVIKSGYRILKTRGKSGARIRVPGGNIPAEVMPVLQRVASEYGNGEIHLTTRQNIEILHIDMKDIEKVKKELSPAIEKMQEMAGAEISYGSAKDGYMGFGTRNFISCVGNRVCPYANCDSSGFAQKIESRFFERPYYMKIGITACPNDCARANVMDIGIIGVVEPVNDSYRCIGCERCAERCSKFCGAISIKNSKAVRDENSCIRCGECTKLCPTMSWKRGRESYNVVVGGRMGKRNPRISLPLVKYVSEEKVIDIISRTYDFIEKHNVSPKKNEFLGYMIDRIGFEEYREFVLGPDDS